MITAKFLFNASLVIGTLAIILLVASIIVDQPMLVVCNVAILGISILCALRNYKEQP